MSEIDRVDVWAKPLAGGVFLALAGIAGAAVWKMGEEFRVAWGPMLGLAGYLGVVLAVNRTRVRLSWEGAEFRYGPLPIGARNRRFASDQIAGVYVREYVSGGKYGGFYRATGVQLKTGQHYEMDWEELPADGIAEKAKEIARALGWRGGVTDIGRGSPGRMLQGWMAWAPLLVAVFGCFCWAIWCFGGL